MMFGMMPAAAPPFKVIVTARNTMVNTVLQPVKGTNNRSIPPITLPEIIN